MDLVVLIPESTRKAKGGDPRATAVDDFAAKLPVPMRTKLTALRGEAASTWHNAAKDGAMPAYLRFQGNMYCRIPRDAWEDRHEGVEVLIVSGLYGVVASRDTVLAYPHSMAEPTPPLGKLNRWWHDRGLPGILAAYLKAVKPRTVVDLLSHEYRDAVLGYAEAAPDLAVRTIDFPGMGRASQPRRGEAVAGILRTGEVPITR